jgi:cyclopropane-fatty-acyl-phospholipid synthase
MWNFLLHKALCRAVTDLALRVTYPDGTQRHYGPAGPAVEVTLHDPALPRALLTNPEMAIGEAYMTGRLTIAGDDLHGFMTRLIRMAEGGSLPGALVMVRRARKGIKRLRQASPLRRAQANVAHHYDIPDHFYRLFLEADMQYTCGYFPKAGMTLEEAQAAKMDHIAAKLLLAPGMRVLDIGCGWGGLALRLAQRHGVHVTGVTLSEVQLQAAQKRAAEMGLSDRVAFRLQDYRDVADRFDRVVSVGMMEHVGQPQYSTYFNKIHQILGPDGVALVHFIGRSSGPSALSPWFQKYIFPGGYAPALSEVLPAIEGSRLVTADIEVWRGHYEQTLRHWLQRFDAHLPEITTLFDETFVRMWRYYLITSELSFTEMPQVLFQVQLTKARLGTPPSRDYLYRP